MGTVARQPAPNPPRTVYSSAYRIHRHSGSTIAIPAPVASWNIDQPLVAELAVRHPEPLLIEPTIGVGR